MFPSSTIPSYSTSQNRHRGRIRKADTTRIKRQLICATKSCEYNTSTAASVVDQLLRLINSVASYNEQTPKFVDDIRNLLFLLHDYNNGIASVTYSYPTSKKQYKLLGRYINLEYNVLYKSEYTPEIEDWVESRVFQTVMIFLKGPSFKDDQYLRDERKHIYDEAFTILVRFVGVDFSNESRFPARILRRILDILGITIQSAPDSTSCLDIRNPSLTRLIESLKDSDYSSGDDTQDITFKTREKNPPSQFYNRQDDRDVMMNASSNFDPASSSSIFPVQRVTQSAFSDLPPSLAKNEELSSRGSKDFVFSTNIHTSAMNHGIGSISSQRENPERVQLTCFDKLKDTSTDEKCNNSSDNRIQIDETTGFRIYETLSIPSSDEDEFENTVTDFDTIMKNFRGYSHNMASIQSCKTTPGSEKSIIEDHKQIFLGENSSAGSLSVADFHKEIRSGDNTCVKTDRCSMNNNKNLELKESPYVIVVGDDDDVEFHFWARSDKSSIKSTSSNENSNASIGFTSSIETNDLNRGIQNSCTKSLIRTRDDLYYGSSNTCSTVRDTSCFQRQKHNEQVKHLNAANNYSTAANIYDIKKSYNKNTINKIRPNPFTRDSNSLKKLTCDQTFVKEEVPGFLNAEAIIVLDDDDEVENGVSNTLNQMQINKQGISRQDNRIAKNASCHGMIESWNFLTPKESIHDHSLKKEILHEIVVDDDDDEVGQTDFSSIIKKIIPQNQTLIESSKTFKDSLDNTKCHQTRSKAEAHSTLISDVPGNSNELNVETVLKNKNDETFLWGESLINREIPNNSINAGKQFVQQEDHNINIEQRTLEIKEEIIFPRVTSEDIIVLDDSDEPNHTVDLAENASCVNEASGGHQRIDEPVISIIEKDDFQSKIDSDASVSRQLSSEDPNSLEALRMKTMETFDVFSDGANLVPCNEQVENSTQNLDASVNETEQLIINVAQGPYQMVSPEKPENSATDSTSEINRRRASLKRESETAERSIINVEQPEQILPTEKPENSSTDSSSKIKSRRASLKGISEAAKQSIINAEERPEQIMPSEIFKSSASDSPSEINPKREPMQLSSFSKEKSKTTEQSIENTEQGPEEIVPPEKSENSATDSPSEKNQKMEPMQSSSLKQKSETGEQSILNAEQRPEQLVPPENPENSSTDSPFKIKPRRASWKGKSETAKQPIINAEERPGQGVSASDFSSEINPRRESMQLSSSSSKENSKTADESIEQIPEHIIPPEKSENSATDSPSEINPRIEPMQQSSSLQEISKSDEVKSAEKDISDGHPPIASESESSVLASFNLKHLESPNVSAKHSPESDIINVLEEDDLKETSTVEINSSTNVGVKDEAPVEIRDKEHKRFGTTELVEMSNCPVNPSNETMEINTESSIEDDEENETNLIIASEETVPWVSSFQKDSLDSSRISQIVEFSSDCREDSSRQPLNTGDMKRRASREEINCMNSFSSEMSKQLVGRKSAAEQRNMFELRNVSDALAFETSGKTMQSNESSNIFLANEKNNENERANDSDSWSKNIGIVTNFGKNTFENSVIPTSINYKYSETETSNQILMSPNMDKPLLEKSSNFNDQQLGSPNMNVPIVGAVETPENAKDRKSDTKMSSISNYFPRINELPPQNNVSDSHNVIGNLNKTIMLTGRSNTELRRPKRPFISVFATSPIKSSELCQKNDKTNPVSPASSFMSLCSSRTPLNDKHFTFQSSENQINEHQYPQLEVLADVAANQEPLGITQYTMDPAKDDASQSPVCISIPEARNDETTDALLNEIENLTSRCFLDKYPPNSFAPTTPLIPSSVRKNANKNRRNSGTSTSPRGRRRQNYSKTIERSKLEKPHSFETHGDVNLNNAKKPALSTSTKTNNSKMSLRSNRSKEIIENQLKTPRRILEETTDSDDSLPLNTRLEKIGFKSTPRRKQQKNSRKYFTKKNKSISTKTTKVMQNDVSSKPQQDVSIKDKMPSLIKVPEKTPTNTKTEIDINLERPPNKEKTDKFMHFKKAMLKDPIKYSQTFTDYPVVSMKLQIGSPVGSKEDSDTSIIKNQTAPIGMVSPTTDLAKDTVTDLAKDLPQNFDISETINKFQSSGLHSDLIQSAEDSKKEIERLEKERTRSIESSRALNDVKFDLKNGMNNTTHGSILNDSISEENTSQIENLVTYEEVKEDGPDLNNDYLSGEPTKNVKHRSVETSVSVRVPLEILKNAEINVSKLFPNSTKSIEEIPVPQIALEKAKIPKEMARNETGSAGPKKVDKRKTDSIVDEDNNHSIKKEKQLCDDENTPSEESLKALELQKNKESKDKPSNIENNSTVNKQQIKRSTRIRQRLLRSDKKGTEEISKNLQVDILVKHSDSSQRIEDVKMINEFIKDVEVSRKNRGKSTESNKETRENLRSSREELKDDIPSPIEDFQARKSRKSVNSVKNENSNKVVAEIDKGMTMTNTHQKDTIVDDEGNGKKVRMASHRNEKECKKISSRSGRKKSGDRCTERTEKELFNSKPEERLKSIAKDEKLDARDKNRRRSADVVLLEENRKKEMRRLSENNEQNEDLNQIIDDQQSKIESTSKVNEEVLSKPTRSRKQIIQPSKEIEENEIPEERKERGKIQSSRSRSSDNRKSKSIDTERPIEIEHSNPSKESKQDATDKTNQKSKTTNSDKSRKNSCTENKIPLEIPSDSSLREFHKEQHQNTRKLKNKIIDKLSQELPTNLLHESIEKNNLPDVESHSLKESNKEKNDKNPQIARSEKRSKHSETKMSNESSEKDRLINIKQSNESKKEDKDRTMRQSEFESLRKETDKSAIKLLDKTKDKKCSVEVLQSPLNERDEIVKQSERSKMSVLSSKISDKTVVLEERSDHSKSTKRKETRSRKTSTKETKIEESSIELKREERKRSRSKTEEREARNSKREESAKERLQNAEAQVVAAESKAKSSSSRGERHKKLDENFKSSLSKPKKKHTELPHKLLSQEKEDPQENQKMELVQISPNLEEIPEAHKEVEISHEQILEESVILDTNQGTCERKDKISIVGSETPESVDVVNEIQLPEEKNEGTESEIVSESCKLTNSSPQINQIIQSLPKDNFDLSIKEQALVVQTQNLAIHDEPPEFPSDVDDKRDASTELTLPIEQGAASKEENEIGEKCPVSQTEENQATLMIEETEVKAPEDCNSNYEKMEVRIENIPTEKCITSLPAKKITMEPECPDVGEVQETKLVVDDAIPGKEQKDSDEGLSSDKKVDMIEHFVDVENKLEHSCNVESQNTNHIEDGMGCIIEHPTLEDQIQSTIPEGPETIVETEEKVVVTEITGENLKVQHENLVESEILATEPTQCEVQIQEANDEVIVTHQVEDELIDSTVVVEEVVSVQQQPIEDNVFTKNEVVYDGTYLMNFDEHSSQIEVMHEVEEQTVVRDQIEEPVTDTQINFISDDLCSTELNTSEPICEVNQNNQVKILRGNGSEEQAENAEECDKISSTPNQDIVKNTECEKEFDTPESPLAANLIETNELCANDVPKHENTVEKVEKIEDIEVLCDNERKQQPSIAVDSSIIQEEIPSVLLPTSDGSIKTINEENQPKHVDESNTYPCSKEKGRRKKKKTDEPVEMRDPTKIQVASDAIVITKSSVEKRPDTDQRPSKSDSSKQRRDSSSKFEAKEEKSRREFEESISSPQESTKTQKKIIEDPLLVKCSEQKSEQTPMVKDEKLEKSTIVDGAIDSSQRMSDPEKDSISGKIGTTKAPKNSVKHDFSEGSRKNKQTSSRRQDKAKQSDKIINDQWFKQNSAPLDQFSSQFVEENISDVREGSNTRNLREETNEKRSTKQLRDTEGEKHRIKEKEIQGHTGKEISNAKQHERSKKRKHSKARHEETRLEIPHRSPKRAPEKESKEGGERKKKNPKERERCSELTESSKSHEKNEKETTAEKLLSSEEFDRKLRETKQEHKSKRKGMPNSSEESTTSQISSSDLKTDTRKSKCKTIKPESPKDVESSIADIVEQKTLNENLINNSKEKDSRKDSGKLESSVRSKSKDKHSKKVRSDDFKIIEKPEEIKKAMETDLFNKAECIVPSYKESKDIDELKEEKLDITIQEQQIEVTECQDISTNEHDKVFKGSEAVKRKSVVLAPLSEKTSRLTGEAKKIKIDRIPEKSVSKDEKNQKKIKVFISLDKQRMKEIHSNELEKLVPKNAEVTTRPTTPKITLDEISKPLQSTVVQTEQDRKDASSVQKAEKQLHNKSGGAEKCLKSNSDNTLKKVKTLGELKHFDVLDSKQIIRIVNLKKDVKAQTSIKTQKLGQISSNLTNVNPKHPKPMTKLSFSIEKMLLPDVKVNCSVNNRRDSSSAHRNAKREKVNVLEEVRFYPSDTKKNQNESHRQSLDKPIVSENLEDKSVPPKLFADNQQQSINSAKVIVEKVEDKYPTLTCETQTSDCQGTQQIFPQPTKSQPPEYGCVSNSPKSSSLEQLKPEKQDENVLSSDALKEKGAEIEPILPNESIPTSSEEKRIFDAAEIGFVENVIEFVQIDRPENKSLPGKSYLHPKRGSTTFDFDDRFAKKPRIDETHDILIKTSMKVTDCLRIVEHHKPAPRIVEMEQTNQSIDDNDIANVERNALRSRETRKSIECIVSCLKANNIKSVPNQTDESLQLESDMTELENYWKFDHNKVNLNQNESITLAPPSINDNAMQLLREETLLPSMIQHQPLVVTAENIQTQTPDVNLKIETFKSDTKLHEFGLVQEKQHAEICSPILQTLNSENCPTQNTAKELNIAEINFYERELSNLADISVLPPQNFTQTDTSLLDEKIEETTRAESIQLANEASEQESISRNQLPDFDRLDVQHLNMCGNEPTPQSNQTNPLHPGDELSLVHEIPAIIQSSYSLFPNTSEVNMHFTQANMVLQPQPLEKTSTGPYQLEICQNSQNNYIQGNLNSTGGVYSFLGSLDFYLSGQNRNNACDSSYLLDFDVEREVIVDYSAEYMLDQQQVMKAPSEGDYNPDNEGDPLIGSRTGNEEECLKPDSPLGGNAEEGLSFDDDEVIQGLLNLLHEDQERSQPKLVHSDCNEQSTTQPPVESVERTPTNIVHRTTPGQSDSESPVAAKPQINFPRFKKIPARKYASSKKPENPVVSPQEKIENIELPKRVENFPNVRETSELPAEPARLNSCDMSDLLKSPEHSLWRNRSPPSGLSEGEKPPTRETETQPKIPDIPTSSIPKDYQANMYDGAKSRRRNAAKDTDYAKFYYDDESPNNKSKKRKFNGKPQPQSSHHRSSYHKNKSPYRNPSPAKEPSINFSPYDFDKDDYEPISPKTKPNMPTKARDLNAEFDRLKNSDSSKFFKSKAKKTGGGSRSDRILRSAYEGMDEEPPHLSSSNSNSWAESRLREEPKRYPEKRSDYYDSKRKPYSSQPHVGSSKRDDRTHNTHSRSSSHSTSEDYRPRDFYRFPVNNSARSQSPDDFYKKIDEVRPPDPSISFPKVQKRSKT